MIQVSNIAKRFGNIAAVDGVSFEVSRGEIFGLLGPNGAGKSTTLNILGSVLSADQGTVKFDGNNSGDNRMILGCAPQALAIYDELTGRENVSFFGSLYNLSGKTLKEKTEAALEFVGLTDRAGDRAKTYSGGMQRRLNLACALVHEPKILLLDEPTVGVDPQSRNMIFDKIEQTRNRGVTIIYTTHYMEEAERLCDRVAIIDQGRILANDHVNSLIAKHGGDSLVLVEFARPPDEGLNLPGTLEGNRLRIETHDPIKTVTDLNARGIEFVSLRIERADLETVFLNLTGRSLRD